MQHLLLFMASKYPSIIQYCRDQVIGFIRDEKLRHKQHCPSLGHLLIYMSLCGPDFSWEHISGAFVRESFIRNQLWIVKKYPDLARTNSSLVREGVVDHDRILKSLEVTQVSRRLISFQVQF